MRQYQNIIYQRNNARNKENSIGYWTSDNSTKPCHQRRETSIAKKWRNRHVENPMQYFKLRRNMCKILYSQNSQVVNNIIMKQWIHNQCAKCNSWNQHLNIRENVSNFKTDNYNIITNANWKDNMCSIFKPQQNANIPSHNVMYYLSHSLRVLHPKKYGYNLSTNLTV